MTRRAWIEKAQAFCGHPEVLNHFANLAEEHGGPFEPEPVAEVLWSSDPEGAAAGWCFLSSGEWMARGHVDLPWSPAASVGPHLRELGRRLLAEWDGKQGPGDWADAAARAWRDRPFKPGKETDGDLAAIIRRHAGEEATDLALGHVAEAHKAAASVERAKVAAWLRARYRDEDESAYRFLADAIERGEHLK